MVLDEGREGSVGRRHSEESRRKMSEAKKGKSVPRRKAVTAQQRKNISDSLKTKWRDPEYRQRVSAAIREGMEKKKKRNGEEAQERLQQKDGQI